MFAVVETHLKIRKLTRNVLTISGTVMIMTLQYTFMITLGTIKRQKWTFYSYFWSGLPRLDIHEMKV